VQLIETVDNLTCLAIVALMGFDSLHQIACSPVMKEKNPLPHTPERSCSEFIGTCGTLCDAVRKISTHVMDEEIGEEIHSLVGKRRTRAGRRATGNPLACGKRRRVAVDAAYLCEDCPSIHGGRRVGRMKSANASMSERTAALGLEDGEEVVVKLSVSSGVALN